MDLFNVLAILISLTAGFSYINYRFVGLPTTVGVMVVALAMSFLLNLLGWFGLGIEKQAAEWLKAIDFDQTVLHGMLSFLLFAGSLHIELSELAQRKWSIGSLAFFGTLISTFLVGTMTWWVLGWVGLALPYIYCLLFGALISPTDPIAVLGILRTAGAPKSLEMNIMGESLFNDGIGIVLFLVIHELAAGSDDVGASRIAGLFLQEAVGGAVFGLVIGYLAYRLLRSIDQYQVEVLITLALVSGGYALADALHLSGPIAMVVAGLLIGNHGRLLAMSETTRENLDVFWELIDESLNAVLFVLIGLEALILTAVQHHVIAGILSIAVVLMARFVAVTVPVSLLRTFRSFSRGAILVMTWGGLRGGISVALALSLPAGPERDVILGITYAVVVFSIIVQGLTIGKVARAMAQDHG